MPWNKTRGLLVKKKKPTYFADIITIYFLYFIYLFIFAIITILNFAVSLVALFEPGFYHV